MGGIVIACPFCEREIRLGYRDRFPPHKEPGGCWCPTAGMDLAAAACFAAEARQQAEEVLDA